HCNGHSLTWILRERDVECRRRFAAQRVVFGVLHHADDLELLLWPARKVESSAQRDRLPTVTLRHRFVDNRDLRCWPVGATGCPIVLWGEIASRKKFDAERLEKFRPDQHA